MSRRIVTGDNRAIEIGEREYRLESPVYRFAQINMADTDEEARTVALSFSSEEPCTRWFGDEILDHKAESVRLDRLRQSGPMLADHDPTRQIGVIEDVGIGADRKGRAVVRFGKSDPAEAEFRDVLDGIRVNVSVGYMVHRMVLEVEDDERGDVYRVTDWEPLEISLVSVPADTSVGVGRSHEPDKPERLQRRGSAMTNTIEKPEPTIDVVAERNAAAADERTRTSTLLEMGAKYADRISDAHELARQCVADGKTPDELRAALLDRMPDAQPVPDPSIGMTQPEVKRFSFLRAIHALANPGDRRAQDAAAFERECSDAAGQRTGKTPHGFLVPNDVLSRDLTVGTATAGGHTVATDLLSGSFIDVLRNRPVVAQLGATYLTGLNGNVAIPRQTGGSTAYWVAEAGAPTESAQAFDQVTMSPGTVGAFTDFSRKLTLQASLDVEAFVRGDLARVLSLALDLAAIEGSGAANQPTGIKNQTGVNTTTFAAATPTWPEIVAMESAVATDNADVGTLGYAIEASMRGTMKTTEKASGTAQFVWEPGDTMNGYQVGVTNQVTNGDVYFGNWADLLIGMWGALDLTVDPFSNSTSGTIRVVALQDADIAVRHPVSFCVSNDGV